MLKTTFLVILLSICTFNVKAQIDSLYKLASQNDEHHETYLLLAEFYEATNQIDSGLFWINKGLEHSVIQQTPIEIDRLLLAKANLASYHSPTTAIDIVKKVIDRNVFNDKTLVECYFRLGNYYSMLGYNNLALESHQKSIEKGKDLVELPQIIRSNKLNMAVIYSTLNKQEMAIDTYEPLLVYFRDEKDTLNTSAILINMGSSLIEIDSLSRAQKVLEEAKEYLSGMDNLIKLPCYLNLLEIYKSNQDNSKYVNLLSEFKVIAFNQPRPYYKAQYYLNIINVPFLNGEKIIRTEVIDSITSLYNQVIDISEQKEILAELYLLEQEGGNYERALDYHIKLKDIEGQINSQENQLKAEELKLQSDLKITIQENEMLSTQNELKANQRNIAIIAVVVVLILLFLTIWLNRQKQKMGKQEKENRQKELASITTLLLTKNEGLEKLYDQISKSQLIVNDSEISDILGDITKNIDLDKDWQEFSKHFNDVHYHFLSNLKNKNPSLTQKELKHCAFIKMGLTTKEIAIMLNITVRGVEKSRSRIRAKLNMLSEEDIYTLFSEI